MSKTVGESLDYLRISGRGDVADAIEEHITEVMAEEPDAVIVGDSVWHAAEFFLMYPHLRRPLIGSTPGEGLMMLEWHIDNEDGHLGELWTHTGIVVMTFRESGLVRYSALSGYVDKDRERLEARGVATLTGVLDSLGDFVEHILREDENE